MKLVNMSSFRNWRKRIEIKGPKPKLPASLLASLKAIYARTDCFRLEKVLEIKARIARGEYHVSGKDVVDKWFPLPKENQTRD